MTFVNGAHTITFDAKEIRYFTAAIKAEEIVRPSETVVDVEKLGPVRTRWVLGLCDYYADTAAKVRQLLQTPGIWTATAWFGALALVPVNSVIEDVYCGEESLALRTYEVQFVEVAT